MARNKRFMCVTECIPFIEHEGILSPKRYRFGDTVECPERINEHFIEVRPEQYNDEPFKILQTELDELGIKYSTEAHDSVLQRLYQEHMRQNIKKEELETLRARAKEIGARIHPDWKDPLKIRKAIEEREIDINIEGDVTEREDTLKTLKAKAKEIGAKVYHGWKDPQKFRTAIENREMELSHD